MLIGRKININIIMNLINDVPSLQAYVDNMVPKYARHIHQLVLNQRYYVAIHIRNMISVPYNTRMSAANALIAGVKIVGTVNVFIEIGEVFQYVNANELQLMLKELYSEK